MVEDTQHTEESEPLGKPRKMKAKRLSSIRVVRLFDRFDYDIPLKLDDRITILHGPNGFGKTTILRLVGHALNARLEQMIEMPCHALDLHFDNGSRLEFEVRRPPRSEGELVQRKRRLRHSGLVVRLDGEEEQVGPLSGSSRERLARAIDPFVPYRRIHPERWLDPHTGTAKSLDEVLALFRGELPPELRDAIDRYGGEVGRRVRAFLEDVRVFVIDTQRLVATREVEVIESRRPWVVVEEGRRPETSPTVMTYAEKLRDDIREHLRRYGERASELDRSLPGRLISGAPREVGDADLRQRYQAVMQRRSALVEAGLLAEQAGVDVLYPSSLEQATKQLLSTYLDDMESKLSVFEGLADRVQLFTRMINELFKHKRIEIGPEFGFKFRTAEGHVLSPARLSSGEQHQLVVLFALLFRVPEGALILVDEPEISLHVEWQQQVLKNFQAISSLRDLDFLIATHSPDIIHDRWDLSVGLGDSQHA
jgi:ABC-type lipoprotein export system ATPase subunit